LSMSSLVILAASGFEISCGKQTDTQTNGGKTVPPPANAVGVGNNVLVFGANTNH